MKAAAAAAAAAPRVEVVLRVHGGVDLRLAKPAPAANAHRRVSSVEAITFLANQHQVTFTSRHHHRRLRCRPPHRPYIQ